MSADRPMRPIEKAAGTSRLYWAVLIGFLLLTFVGTQPFSSETYYEKSFDALGRFVIITLFLASLPLLWRHHAEAMESLRSNRGLLWLVGLCLVSVLWSQYPSYTLKRVVVLVMLAATALAVAAATREMRTVHTAMFVTLTGIVVANVIYTVLWPAEAITFDPPGVRGFYAEKNAAGAMAMSAVVAGGTWIAGAAHRRDRLIGACALLVCFAFLVVTKSKTSTAMALLALALFYTVAATRRFGDPAQRALLSFCFLSAAAALVGLLVIDFAIGDAMAAAFGDFTGRDELWAFVWKAVSLRPILGYGYGAFWDVGDANDPLDKLDPGTWLGDVEPGVINQAHNGYLELWLQMGLPVMLLAVAAVVATVGAAVRLATSRTVALETRIGYGMIAAMLLVYLLHNTMEASLLMRERPLCNLALLLAFLATPRLAGSLDMSQGASR